MCCCVCGIQKKKKNHIVAVDFHRGLCSSANEPPPHATTDNRHHISRTSARQPPWLEQTYSSHARRRDAREHRVRLVWLLRHPTAMRRPRRTNLFFRVLAAFVVLVASWTQTTESVAIRTRQRVVDHASLMAATSATAATTRAVSYTHLTLPTIYSV